MAGSLARPIIKVGKEIASEMGDLFSSAAKREARDVPDAPIEEAPTPVAREIPDAPVEETPAPIARETTDIDIPQRLYHGTTASNIDRFKFSKEGVLGEGVYLTPDPKYASSYAAEEGGNVIPVAVDIKNPLVVQGSDREPSTEILKALGVSEDKAQKITEKAFDEKGNITKEISSRARKQGYDAVILKDKDGAIQEIVSYNPDSITSGIGSPKSTIDVKEAPTPVAKKTMDDDDSLTFDEFQAKWRSENEIKNEQKQLDSVSDAAVKLDEGKITSKEFRNIVKRDLPIKPIEEMVEVPSFRDLMGALQKSQVEEGIINLTKTLKDGEKVASRLDIPAYRKYNKWIVTLHDGTKSGGKAIGYGKTATLDNVEFISSAKGGLNIAKTKSKGGTDKGTIARMYGNWRNVDDDLAAKRAERILANKKDNKYIDPEDGSEWVQVGMNPFRSSYFYDKLSGSPLKSAEEVIQVGPLVFARGAKRLRPSDFKKGKTLTVTTKAGKKIPFNEGGIVTDKKSMSEQMDLFQEGGLVDQGGEIDPESGNEVPTGSLKEEVRDDIPANLSEGEFVMPAYAVRFHGIDKMMQLVDEAKVKLERMEQMGMMGNSEEATLPDNTLLEGGQKEQEVLNYQVGGYVPPAVGAPVQPYIPGQTVYTPPPAASTIQQQPSTVASQFNIQPASQMYQQQTGYTPPMIRPVPIQQGQVTPKIENYLAASGGKYDELKEYVNDAGNTLSVPFIQGKPIYPIPEGYRLKDTDSVTTQPDKVTTTTTMVTPKETDGEDPVTVTGGNQANIGGLSPGEVASGISVDKSVQSKIGLGLSELNKSPMAKVGLGFALGGPMGAIGSVIGLAANEMFGASIPSISDLASKVFGKPQNQLSQTELDQISNLTSAQTQASIAEALGVSSLSGNYGSKPGDIDAATGGIFNDRGIAMAVDLTGRIIGQATGPDDDLPSFNSFGSWGKELSASFNSGWYGGPLGDLEVSQLDTEGKLNYSKYLSEIGKTQEALDLSLEAFEEDYEQSDLGKQDAADKEAYDRGPTQDPTEAPEYGDDPTSTSKAEAAAAAAEAEAAAQEETESYAPDDPDQTADEAMGDI